MEVLSEVELYKELIIQENPTGTNQPWKTIYEIIDKN